MKTLPFLLFFSIVFLVGCGQSTPPETAPETSESTHSDFGQDSESAQRTEIGNFEFVHHIQNDGPKPQPGNIVQYNYRLMSGQKEEENTFGKKPVGAYFPEDEVAQSDPKPVVEALRRMSAGDSLTLIARLSQDPDGFYKYDIKCANIIVLDENIPIQKAENEAEKNH